MVLVDRSENGKVAAILLSLALNNYYHIPYGTSFIAILAAVAYTLTTNKEGSVPLIRYTG
jgi:hypothetical protein